MHCLRLFIVVLQELHCLLQCLLLLLHVVCLLKAMCLPNFIMIGCCVSELHGHLCPYHNVLPEAANAGVIVKTVPPQNVPPDILH